MNHLAKFSLCLLLFTSSFICAAEPVRKEWKNLSYYSESALSKAGEYQKTQCVLDISAPENAKGLPVLLWFHGGGLSVGSKAYAPMLKNEQIVNVAVGYRLSPKAKFPDSFEEAAKEQEKKLSEKGKGNFPDFIEDAAAAAAWAFANIERYGGDSKKIFVGGHSAGAYLSAMVGFDSRWLKPHEIQPERIAGLILLSGQVTTHFHVRQLLNYPQPEQVPVIDENAPFYHISVKAPPMVLIVGDRKKEWPARVEENEFLYATLRVMKHPHVEFYENLGCDHGTVASSPDTARQMKAFIEKVTK
ncbi:MAG: alpha/beta hydrolase [Planctomycetaceae bacterium]|nr:alpha/beta hydrolase [Planctomycetaceae bacterium]